MILMLSAVPLSRIGMDSSFCYCCFSGAASLGFCLADDCIIANAICNVNAIAMFMAKYPPGGAMKVADKYRERFERRVARTDGCWLWVAGKSSAGYGRM